MIAVGLFVDRDALFNTRYRGLFPGGSFHLLGAQVAAVVAITIWSALMSYLILKAIAIFMPIRVDTDIEKTGLDMTLNNLNTDYDWDKILLPNPHPNANIISNRNSKKRTRQRLIKVINAIIAVNRLLQHGSNSVRFRHEIKAYNTKVLAQSWSSIRPFQQQPLTITSASASGRIRPPYTKPHS